ncbi:hypothetical protein, partial [Rhizobium leguminosarum]|uniref:hypothetical protein n=1 Tax=Rhizobium leguminosarum TaxID=384 RepID=UPI003F9518C7
MSDKSVEDKTKKLTSKEACWDQFATQAGQMALGQLTNKTITWVNKGFDGNPLYIRNIDSYLKNSEKYQIKEFLP